MDSSLKDDLRLLIRYQRLLLFEYSHAQCADRKEYLLNKIGQVAQQINDFLKREVGSGWQGTLSDQYTTIGANLRPFIDNQGNRCWYSSIALSDEVMKNITDPNYRFEGGDYIQLPPAGLEEAGYDD